MAIKSTVNAEIKKVIGRVKEKQGQFEALVRNQDWVDEARKYADRQSKEVRKILSGDVSKVKTFLEKERKELEKFQKQIPGEVKKLRQFVLGQRKELEQLIANVKKVASQGAKGASAPQKNRGKKKASAKKATKRNPAASTEPAVTPVAPASAKGPMTEQTGSGPIQS